MFSFTFMNETLSHLFLWAMACSFTKYFRFPHIISYLPWESRTCFYFVVQKMERKKMNSAVYCIWHLVTNTLLLCAQQQTIQVLLWRVSCHSPRTQTASHHKYQ